MVIMPSIQLQSVKIVRLGRSYHAIQSALAGEGEVLVVFVPEAEIPPYRSDEPQQLPAVGVIARLVQAEIQPDDMLLIELDVRLVRSLQLGSGMTHSTALRAFRSPTPKILALNHLH